MKIGKKKPCSTAASHPYPSEPGKLHSDYKTPPLSSQNWGGASYSPKNMVFCVLTDSSNVNYANDDCTNLKLQFYLELGTYTNNLSFK